MKDIPAYPKPKDLREAPYAVRTFRDGREACNLLCKAGRDLYESRIRQMWDRQKRICCLHKHIPTCPGKLNWAQATFEHEIPRGFGGGKRDDRIELIVRQRDGTYRTIWQNGAAHPECNIAKSSRRIPYNKAHNDAV